MNTIAELLGNYFTHKDFLPPASEIAGTIFTPLHIAMALCWAAVVALAVWRVSKLPHDTIRRVFAVVWAVFVVFEVVIVLYEYLTSRDRVFEWTGSLSLYPCSIFLYAMPFAVWGKGRVRYAACGYVCSLGLLGGLINFVYPANVLSHYSVLSFSGLHTFSYHSMLIFCALTMLHSGYHTYREARRWRDLLLPAVPCLAVSVVAHAVNFSPIDADYMFFKLNSFFFAPIGAATSDWLSVVMVYALYLFIHALPYLPHFVKNRRQVSEKQLITV